MPFNHYAKIKRILEDQPDGWSISLINEPTSARNFKGELIQYPYYYRIYDHKGQAIKYCKFQQLERLAASLGVPVDFLPLVINKQPLKTNL